MSFHALQTEYNMTDGKTVRSCRPAQYACRTGVLYAKQSSSQVFCYECCEGNLCNRKSIDRDRCRSLVIPSTARSTESSNYAGYGSISDTSTVKVGI